jgi:hypothetical protein
MRDCVASTPSMPEPPPRPVHFAASRSREPRSPFTPPPLRYRVLLCAACEHTPRHSPRSRITPGRESARAQDGHGQSSAAYCSTIVRSASPRPWLVVLDGRSRLVELCLIAVLVAVLRPSVGARLEASSSKLDFIPLLLLFSFLSPLLSQSNLETLF